MREAEKKIWDRAALAAECRRLRAEGRRIAFTNGCFDLMHAGHASSLEFARKQGDVLVVALNTDASVRRLKGPERPIVDEKYDLTKHPNIKYTPDGGGKPYNHDGLDGAPPEVSFDASRAEDYALLDGDELTGLLTGEIDYFESPDEHDEHIYTNNL